MVALNHCTHRACGFIDFGSLAGGDPSLPALNSASIEIAVAKTMLRIQLRLPGIETSARVCELTIEITKSRGEN
jgi:hypothetical protein